MISTEVLVNSSVSQVWEAWIRPAHIVHWYFASEDWCCPSAELDCRVGGHFSIRMEAKDKSFGFDFNGTFTAVEEEKHLNYTLEDGRNVECAFITEGSNTRVIWKFEPENVHPHEFQQQGWQAILNNFKSYVEHNG